MLLCKIRMKTVPCLQDWNNSFSPQLFYGPHLKFLPEGDTETPDENDLFPSTPLVRITFAIKVSKWGLLIQQTSEDRKYLIIKFLPG